MAKKNETKHLELNIPQDVMAETAEIIEQNEMEANILGKTEDDCIIVGFDYAPEQRDSIMEILELIEDFNGEEESEEETED
jgi:hypothetical protein